MINLFFFFFLPFWLFIPIIKKISLFFLQRCKMSPLLLFKKQKIHLSGGNPKFRHLQSKNENTIGNYLSIYPQSLVNHIQKNTSIKDSDDEENMKKYFFSNSGNIIKKVSEIDQFVDNETENKKKKISYNRIVEDYI